MNAESASGGIALPATKQPAPANRERLTTAARCAMKQKGHRGHFYCGNRICVPHFFCEERDRPLGGAEMDRALDWMKQLDARATESGIVIEDPIQYVRQAFRESLRAYKRLGKRLTES